MEGDNENGVEEKKIREDYESVCSKLNMDQESMDSAWRSYSEIRDYYTLEGSHLEWLGCALYVAGQSLQLETMEGVTRKGNSVSLTQILRATKLNLIEFFKKMKKWQEMAQLPLSFQQKIEALERKFEVASIIYEKYRKVFRQLFNMSDDKPEPNAPARRGRKPHHKKPCSAHDVFRFGWTLYIHIKSKYPLINDDLVNSHHLLLCCLDMIYSAAHTKRRDLLLPDCPIKVGEEEMSDDGGQSGEVSVLGQLCDKFNGIEKECRVIRDYHWNDRLRNLFASKILSAGSGAVKSGSGSGSSDSSHFLLVLSPNLFQANEKNLNRDYEMSVLEEGDFDERVFLHPSANEEIGTPLAVGAHNFRSSLAAHTPPQHVQYGTPLLGREMLGTRDHRLTPASEATHHVSQLFLLLEGCRPEPSEYVRRLCSSCMANPLPELETTVKEMGDKLVNESPSEGDIEPANFAKKRLHLSLSLYYKLLDSIMRDEEKKHQDVSSLQNILEYKLFHQSLYSLCVEIVLFCYNSQSRTFPWVLDMFGISAYHFYKLIEVAIKLESSFPRGIIKHLNRVEEMVLSQLAWMSGSPLFDAIDAAGSVPPYKDVALPNQAGMGGRGISSPLPHPRITKLGARVPDSPLSAIQRGHITSAAVSPGSTARRALFSPGKSTARKSLVPIAPKPPQASAASSVAGGGGAGAGGVTVQLITDVLKKKLQQTTPTNSPSKDLESPAKSTAPVIPPSANLLGSTSSPAKGLNLIGSSDILPSAAASTVLSPSSKGLPLSPGGVRPLIPTPPPIPSVTVTPTLSASKICVTTPSSASPRPKRTGSLALFYRKMYQLASIRIKDLCERLNLPENFVQKVWTCFEHCMVKSPDILRDRHIDQIIMCSIYILSKALNMDVTFQEMMRQYRHQPQAKSHVYKSVLLNNGPRRSPPPDTSSSDASSNENAPGQSDHPPTATTPLEELLYRPDIVVGARGDIIQFYNKIFIGFLKDFVLQFSPSESEANPSLSPLPVISKAVPSPRKLSKYQNIFISPHKPSASPSSSTSSVTAATLSPLAKPIGKPYIIQKSPNVELKELSRAIKSTKRPLDLTASPSLSPSCPASKRLRLSPSQARSSSPNPRKTNALLQAMNSLASDRARTVSSSSNTGEQ